MPPKKVLFILCICIFVFVLFGPQPGMAQDSVKTAPLYSLDTAIQKALKDSPNLHAFGSAVSGAISEKGQAGTFQNPEVSVEIENIAGGGSYKGFDSAEISYGVSQLIEIGGKIQARENVANNSIEIANLDYQGAALDLIYQVTVAYLEIVASQENIRLAQKQKELAITIQNRVNERVSAAASPIIQKIRAQIEVSNATIALNKAIQDQATAQKKMAVLLGEEKVELSTDLELFFAVTPPKITDSEGRLKDNPDVLKLNQSLTLSLARFELEKVNAIPDPRAQLVMKNFRSSGDLAFGLGVSLPLPVMNTNYHNMEKAKADIAKTEYLNRHSVLELVADLAQTHQALESAYLQVSTLRDEILPASQKANALAVDGYKQGRFSYLEVLDSQRSAIFFQQQYIEELKTYHIAQSKIDRLMAVYLPKIQKKGAFYVQ